MVCALLPHCWPSYLVGHLLYLTPLLTPRSSPGVPILIERLWWPDWLDQTSDSLPIVIWLYLQPVSSLLLIAVIRTLPDPWLLLIYIYSSYLQFDGWFLFILLQLYFPFPIPHEGRTEPYCGIVILGSPSPYCYLPYWLIVLLLLLLLLIDPDHYFKILLLLFIIILVWTLLPFLAVCWLTLPIVVIAYFCGTYYNCGSHCYSYWLDSITVVVIWTNCCGYSQLLLFQTGYLQCAFIVCCWLCDIPNFSIITQTTDPDPLVLNPIIYSPFGQLWTPAPLNPLTLYPWRFPWLLDPPAQLVSLVGGYCWGW